MQGLFVDAPLIGVLELLHVSRKTGVLTADAGMPFSLSFQGGQVSGGGILDWQGLDAIYACPLLPGEGSFSFTVQAVEGEMLAPYGKITADWARYSDDWQQICAVVGSPSALVRGNLPLFDSDEGRSIRAASRSAQLPLFEVAERVLGGVRSGRLTPLDSTLPSSPPAPRPRRPRRRGSLRRACSSSTTRRAFAWTRMCPSW